MCALLVLYIPVLEVKNLTNPVTLRINFNLLKPTGYVMHQQV